MDHDIVRSESDSGPTFDDMGPYFVGPSATGEPLYWSASKSQWMPMAPDTWPMAFDTKPAATSSGPDKFIDIDTSGMVDDMGPAGPHHSTEDILDANLVLLNTIYEKWDRIPDIYKTFLCVAIQKELERDVKKCIRELPTHDVFDSVSLSNVLTSLRLLEFVASDDLEKRFALDTLRTAWERVRRRVNQKVDK